MSAGDENPFEFARPPPLVTSAAATSAANYGYNLLSPTAAGWRSPASTVGTDSHDFEPDLDFKLDFDTWSDTLSPVAPPTGFTLLEGAVRGTQSGASPAIAGLNLGMADELDTIGNATGESIPDDDIQDGDMFGMDLDIFTAWPPVSSETSSVASSVTSAPPPSSPPQIPSVTVSSFPDIAPVRRYNTWCDAFLSTYPGGPDAISASPSSAEFTSPPIGGLTRVSRSPSLKRRRSKWNCMGSIEPPQCGCAKPDRPKPGQQRKLDGLPMEILLIIFEYAYLTPDKPKGCQHEIENKMIAGITRRATTGSIGPSQPWIMGSSFLNYTNSPSTVATSSSIDTESQAESTPADVDPDEPDTKTEELRIYRAKTLLNIMLTCRRFHMILAADSGTDEKFWKTAARWCWDWLPDKLADVQGSSHTSQTSWRNLVAVFMRSENGLFGKKNGGKGGVESFGARREGIDALTWEGFQRLKSRGDGKRRKVVLVCAQPGPDVFTVLPREGGDGWILSLSTRNHPMNNTLLYMDNNGDFGRLPARLSPNMKRNPRCPDYFQPDIFAIEGDRMKLVKVSHDGEAPHGIVRVEWDLSVIDEMVADSRARPARAVSHQGRLLCNLYTHGTLNPAEPDLLQLLDPPENSAIFCLGAPLTEEIPTPLSPSQFGKQPASQTTLLWRRDFIYPQAGDFDPSQSLHAVICNLALTADHAVALIRWNITTPESAEEFVDRAFHILSPTSGDTIRTLEFPHLYWDYRHHDMSADYNNIRLRKLQRLFNHLPPGTAVGAGNRCTRIHNDRFLITNDGRLISGSHDYCNWVWDLNREGSKEKGVYTATQNDAGKYDEFEVLDDYYWSNQRSSSSDSNSVKDDDPPDITDSERSKPQIWTSTAERAGWWVRTPNQVLCFWHNIALSTNHTLFAACRPGKLFLWNLGEKNPNDNIIGFQHQSGKSRWLGKLAKTAEGLRSRLARWFVWGGVVPKQGLWMVVEEEDDDGEKRLRTVYVEREELLRVSGVGGRWEFGRRDFVMEDEGSEAYEDDDDEDDDDDDDDDDAMDEDTDTDLESDGADVVSGMVAVGVNTLIPGQSVSENAERRKRRRVSSSAGAAQWEDEIEGSFAFAAEGEEVI